MKKNLVDDNLQLAQHTLEHWLSFKRYLIKSFGEDPVAAEDETNFLEVKSAVAKTLRTMQERMKSFVGIDYGGSQIRDLLNRCVSVGHLRNLPPTDKRNIYKDWHSVFIRLSRTVGAFKFMSEGYIPPPPKGKQAKKPGWKFW